mmetsp:Transcript_15532/g.43047  ORF Transcript_15532/g.43047 Transcript_15532/m.43047 type:complete len:227 (-) Transcript_15532:1021-1701(-)
MEGCSRFRRQSRRSAETPGRQKSPPLASTPRARSADRCTGRTGLSRTRRWSLLPTSWGPHRRPGTQLTKLVWLASTSTSNRTSTMVTAVEGISQHRSVKVQQEVGADAELESAGGAGGRRCVVVVCQTKTRCANPPQTKRDHRSKRWSSRSFRWKSADRPVPESRRGWRTRRRAWERLPRCRWFAILGFLAPKRSPCRSLARREHWHRSTRTAVHPDGPRSTFRLK